MAPQAQPEGREAAPAFEVDGGEVSTHVLDPPARFHTPAMSRHLLREKLDAEGRRSYRGVIRRSDGGAERPIVPEGLRWA